MTTQERIDFRLTELHELRDELEDAIDDALENDDEAAWEDLSDQLDEVENAIGCHAVAGGIIKEER